MYCSKCGAQIPDDSEFCSKCGNRVAQAGTAGNAGAQQSPQGGSQSKTIAASGVTELKCPGCGAPIKPQVGEMVITCEYCGTAVSLAAEGWKNVQSNTMLPLKIQTEDDIEKVIREHMDHGLLHRHEEEKSRREELTLTMVPYWIVPVSARTNYVYIDAAAELGGIAETAAMMGMMDGAMGGGRGRGFGEGMVDGMMFGGMAGGGFGAMGGGGGAKRQATLNANYNYPVVAVKGLAEYQPAGYEFNLTERVVFDSSKIPKSMKLLNGDVGEDSARASAKTNVDQLQSHKAHKTHHNIQNISTESDVSDPEILHVPVWYARFDRKGRKEVLVIDGHSGNIINSIGIE